MAKAEEYGSHDTTFEAPGAGVMVVVDSADKLLSHAVEKMTFGACAESKTSQCEIGSSLL